jgi:sugar phosphate isomerase/epimerase
VKIGLETHDDWSASKRVAELVTAARHSAVGVLWDVEHPWRVTGEQPAETFGNIGRWVIYTHFKDARQKDGGALELCRFGEGQVPVRQSIEALRAGGYQGWLTLEHEKRWHAELEEPEEAFVRYVEVMRGLIQPRGRRAGRKGAP